MEFTPTLRAQTQTDGEPRTAEKLGTGSNRAFTWLYEESYQLVGDVAETISLMLPPQTPVQQDTFALDDVPAFPGRIK